MTAAHGGSDTLEALANSAGVSEYLMRYLKARGLVSVGAVALLSSQAEEFSRTLLEPLASGWGSPVTYQVSADELPIAKATLLFLRELCIESRQRAAAAIAAASPQPVVAASGAAAATPTKVPTELPAGEWQKMVSRYNSQQLGGRDRCFPEAELVGAESIPL